MTKFFQKNALLFSLFQTITLVSGLEFTLDLLNDEGTMWKISGNSLYLENGKRLRRGPVGKYLPDGFKHESFDMTQGIWAVVPNDNIECAVFQDTDSMELPFMMGDLSQEEETEHDHNEEGHKHSNKSTPTAATTTKPSPCDISAFAGFQWSLKDQILTSITVYYNYGGDSKIRVSGGELMHPYEIHANNKQSNQWEHFQIDVGGHHLLVEAIVNATGDYVLIDRIVIETLTLGPAPTRANTATTTTTTTTTKATTTIKPAKTNPETPTSSSTIPETPIVNPSSPSRPAEKPSSPTTPTEKPLPPQPAPISPSSGQSGMLAILSLNMMIFVNTLFTVMIMKLFLL